MRRAMPEIKTGVVHANGLNFHYHTAGEGPLALCLHGFPDSAWSYHLLLQDLAQAGYRAVAPFMRGYAPTQIPHDAQYGTRALAADVVALHEALGGDSHAVLIGHDWGAVAAYAGALAAPARWRRCVTMSVPPLAVYNQIGLSYEQIKRSFYFWFFQLRVAEAVVSAGELAFLDGLWADWSPGYDATQELGHAKQSLREPANLAAALGYYRAFFDPSTFGSSAFTEEQASIWGARLSQKTLYLHGQRDGCLSLDEATMRGALDFLGPHSQVERVPGVGHFLLLEDPQRVNGRVLAFLTED